MPRANCRFRCRPLQATGAAYLFFHRLGLLSCFLIATCWIGNLSADVIENATLRVEISEGNGAITAYVLKNVESANGSRLDVDFYNPSNIVSDFGFQLGTDVDTGTLNAANRSGWSGFIDEVPVTVRGGNQVVGTYTGGKVEDAANIDFVRTYSLVDDLPVLKIHTTLVNRADEVVKLRYFDTYDPDQDIPWGTFGTINDVDSFYDIQVGETIGPTSGIANLLASEHPDSLVAAGNPFWLRPRPGDPTVNDFFANPHDGNGTRADQGLHLGYELEIAPGQVFELESFNVAGEDEEAAYRHLAEAIGVPEPSSGIVSIVAILVVAFKRNRRTKR